MTQPLALVVYEKLLPGTQLVNRLQDLKYRVRAVTDAGVLVECARQEKPMVVLADLNSTRQDVCGAIARLKQDRATQHIPVIVFAPEESVEIQTAARKAGATLVVSDTAVLSHLPNFLEQALQIE
jgi:CheY-like chemotaxis protein